MKYFLEVEVEIDRYDFLNPIPIFEVKYRPIIPVADIIGCLFSLWSSNSHIGLSSKGQIGR